MTKPFVPLVDYLRDNPLTNHSSREIPLWVEGKPPYELTSLKGNTLAFGGLVLGLSKTMELVLENTGFQPLHVQSVLVPSADYELVNAAPEIIYPGRTVTLLVKFVPSTFGLLVGNLVVNCGQGGRYTFRLLGTGIWDHVGSVTAMLENLWGFLQRSVQPAIISDGPSVSLPNTSIEFEDGVDVDGESQLLLYTITNAGNEDLIIDNIAITGDFEIVP
jgi:hypothetical protein